MRDGSAGHECNLLLFSCLIARAPISRIITLYSVVLLFSPAHIPSHPIPIPSLILCPLIPFSTFPYVTSPLASHTTHPFIPPSLFSTLPLTLCIIPIVPFAPSSFVL